MISVTAVSSARNVRAQLLFLLLLLPAVMQTFAVTVTAITSTHCSQHQNQHQHPHRRQHRHQYNQEQMRRRRRIQVDVRGGGSAGAGAGSVSGKSTKNSSPAGGGADQAVRKMANTTTSRTTTATIEKTKSKNRNALVVGLKNFLASGCAAGCSKLILAPFDTIKTLQQHQQSSVTMNALSFVEATRSIVSRPRGVWELYVSCFTRDQRKSLSFGLE